MEADGDSPTDDVASYFEVPLPLPLAGVSFDEGLSDAPVPFVSLAGSLAEEDVSPLLDSPWPPEDLRA
jgi:hypothetical protein